MPHNFWMPVFLLLGAVSFLSFLWVRALARQNDIDEEREEETRQRMVELCESYDYRTDTFK